MSRVYDNEPTCWSADEGKDGEDSWVRAHTVHTSRGKLKAIQFDANEAPVLGVRELVSLRDWLDARIAEIEAAKPKRRKPSKTP